MMYSQRMEKAVILLWYGTNENAPVGRVTASREGADGKFGEGEGLPEG